MYSSIVDLQSLYSIPSVKLSNRLLFPLPYSGILNFIPHKFFNSHICTVSFYQLFHFVTN